ncbi:uncharacterized protein LOC131937006 isoform X2 [Physella acuta]|nr:uncharacterized protein LOC131937006 isoform X2 [Physella acuta]
MLQNADLLILGYTCLLFLMKECGSHPDYYHQSSSSWLLLDRGTLCNLWEQTGCREGECCVKEVISFDDLDRNLVARTVCKPLLAFGELCLRMTEGYICDCAQGLHCEFKNNETYGHCATG